MGPLSGCEIESGEVVESAYEQKREKISDEKEREVEIKH